MIIQVPVPVVQLVVWPGEPPAQLHIQVPAPSIVIVPAENKLPPVAVSADACVPLYIFIVAPTVPVPCKDLFALHVVIVKVEFEVHMADTVTGLQLAIDSDSVGAVAVA